MVWKRSAGGRPLVATFAAAALLWTGRPAHAASPDVGDSSGAPKSPAEPVVVSGGASTPTLMSRPFAAPAAATVTSPGPSLHAAPIARPSAPPPRVTFAGQVRLRHASRGVFDYRLPGTFGRSTAQSPLAGGDVSLVRTRIGAQARPAPRVRLSFGLEDARALDLAASATSAPATFDVEHAWVEFDSLAGRRVFARLGRQPLVVAGRRILGGAEWSLRTRAYDGARLGWAPRRFELEGFAVQPHDAGAGMGAPRRVLSGCDASWRADGRFEAEGWHLERAYPGAAWIGESGTRGGLFDATSGLRTRARLGAWELRAEGGVQRGRRAGDPVHASYGAARVTAFLNSAWRTRVALDRVIASGDRTFGDGVSQRFEPLERPGDGPPDALAIRGFANTSDWSARVFAQTAPAWTVETEWHVLSLSSATDAWSGAEGAALRRDPSGGSGTGLGRELDVRVTWAAGPRTSLVGVASRFSAGPFVRSTGGGSSASGGWLQLVAGF